MTTEKIKLLEEFSAAWNRHDIDALMGMMADECVFYTVAGPGVMGTTWQGRDEVRKGFEAAWTTVPDAAWKDAVHFVVGDRGVSESTFSGTNPDGTRTEARMVDVFTFKDGKIAVKNAFRKNRPPLPAGGD